MGMSLKMEGKFEFCSLKIVKICMKTQFLLISPEIFRYFKKIKMSLAVLNSIWKIFLFLL